mmetsp:Transcript_3330/g.2882  ORF Transcript_3330/g.2882 Transcript_3330/m.2882 type:complete len:225 (-) Transcript_3330:75-749(-)
MFSFGILKEQDINMDQENKSSLAKSNTPGKSSTLDNLEKPSIEKSPISFSPHKRSFNRFQESRYDENIQPELVQRVLSGQKFTGNTPTKSGNRTPFKMNQFEMSPADKEYKNSIVESPYTAFVNKLSLSPAPMFANSPSLVRGSLFSNNEFGSSNYIATPSPLRFGNYEGRSSPFPQPRKYVQKLDFGSSTNLLRREDMNNEEENNYISPAADTITPTFQGTRA